MPSAPNCGSITQQNLLLSIYQEPPESQGQ